MPVADKYYAVLAGDIVKSGKLTYAELVQARSVIAASLDRFDKKFPAQLIGKAEFYRGDSWEALLARPQYAMRLSLDVMAALKAEMDVETRIAIGIGRLRHVDSSKVSYSLGEACDLSQSAIKNMRGAFNLSVAVAPHDALETRKIACLSSINANNEMAADALSAYEAINWAAVSNPVFRY